MSIPNSQSTSLPITCFCLGKFTITKYQILSKLMTALSKKIPIKKTFQKNSNSAGYLKKLMQEFSSSSQNKQDRLAKIFLIKEV